MDVRIETETAVISVTPKATVVSVSLPLVDNRFTVSFLTPPNSKNLLLSVHSLTSPHGPPILTAIDTQ